MRKWLYQEEQAGEPDGSGSGAAGGEAVATDEGGDAAPGPLIPGPDDPPAKAADVADNDGAPEDASGDTAEKLANIRKKYAGEDGELDVDKLMKGYMDAQQGIGDMKRKLGVRGEEAPKNEAGDIEYAINVPEGLPVEIDAENPLLKTAMELCGEMDLPQSQFDKLVEAYITDEHDKLLNEEIDAGNEMAKLGPQAKQITTEVGQFFSSLLEPDDFAVFQNMVSTAEGVQLMATLKDRFSTSTLYPSGMDTQTPAKTVQQIQEGVDAERYRKEPAYREQVAAELKRATNLKDYKPGVEGDPAAQ